MVLLDVIPLPDNIFWYLLSTILSGTLIRIIWMYVNRIEKLFEKLIDGFAKLAVNDKVQDVRLDKLEGGKRGKDEQD